MPLWTFDHRIGWAQCFVAYCAVSKDTHTNLNAGHYSLLPRRGIRVKYKQPLDAQAEVTFIHRTLTLSLIATAPISTIVIYRADYPWSLRTTVCHLFEVLAVYTSKLCTCVHRWAYTCKQAQSCNDGYEFAHGHVTRSFSMLCLFPSRQILVSVDRKDNEYSRHNPK